MVGRRDLIGLYSSENENSRFWLTELPDVKQLNDEDILTTCVYGLKGRETAFQKTKIQLYVVRPIRRVRAL